MNARQERFYCAMTKNIPSSSEKIICLLYNLPYKNIELLVLKIVLAPLMNRVCNIRE